jgi:hypothetical protein
MWEIRQAIHRAGLRYHKAKKYVDCPAEITGVFVDGARLLAPNRQFQKMRVVKSSLKLDLGNFTANKLKNKLIGLRGQLAQIRIQT